MSAYPHEPLTDPLAVGVDPRALGAVLGRFAEQCRTGVFPGGQIAVRRHGRLILDEAIGHARGARPSDGESLLRASTRTRFPVFSASKPLIAMCVALLEERGRLDVRAPIRETIPEFGTRGKADITTLDVLTHRGGIPMPDLVRRPEAWHEWERVVDAMCAVRPTYPRGTLAYHPLEYGWILSEIVRRVAGRPLPAFLDDEFLVPAGLESMRFWVNDAELAGVARPYWLGADECYIGDVNMADIFERVLLLPTVANAFVPGASLFASAGALAAFYDLLLGGGRTRGGRKLLSDRTITRYTERQAAGYCRANRAPLAVGSGFLVGTRIPSMYGWRDNRSCFGHVGAFCTVAFADRRLGLSVAMVTNANRGPADLVRRFTRLSEALRRACS